MMIEVGCGATDITPKIGTPLSGFIFRENKPSTSVDDPLYVRVLALRSEGQVHWLVDYELLGISSELQTRIEADLTKALGDAFSPGNCVILAVHNHSGPPTMPLRGEAPPDPGYLAYLCQSTVYAAKEAFARLQPVTMWQAWVEVPDLTYNRRALLADGRVSMALNPDETVLERGPVDRRFTLLVWKNQKEKNVAAMVHFACHGVAVCTQAIGSDIPGQIAQQFEHLLDAPCLYIQGAAGDVNPLVVSTERSLMLPWMDQLMKIVQSLPGQLQPVSVDSIQVKRGTLLLDFSPLPSRAEVVDRIKQYERIVEGDVTSPEVYQALRTLGDLMNVKPGELPEVHKAAYCAKALLLSERDILSVLDNQGAPKPCPLGLELWRLGNLVFVFIGAEIFSRTGLEMRGLMKGLTILPVTYATPVVGYIPDVKSTQQGGYEVESAWHFYGCPAPFVPESERRIISKITQLLVEVNR